MTAARNVFTRCLRDRQIPISHRRTFLLEALEELSARKSDPALPRVARGVFLRVELPALHSEIGLEKRVSTRTAMSSSGVM